MRTETPIYLQADTGSRGLALQIKGGENLVPVPITRKFQGGLNEAYKTSSLPQDFFDLSEGKMVSVTPSVDQYIDAQSPIYVPKTTPREAAEQYTQEIVKTVSGLLLVGGTKEQNAKARKNANVKSFGGDDLSRIIPVAAELAKPTDERSDVIRVVLGATDKMPLRGVTYITAALAYAENLQRMGIEPPQVQVVFPHNISARFNHMDRKLVDNQARTLIDVAQRYQAEYFPEIGNIVYLQDKNLEKNGDYRKDLIEARRILYKDAPPKLREQLERKGEKKDFRINSFYAAAHVPMHDLADQDVVEPYNDINQNTLMIPKPNVIISMGSQSEGLFYATRQFILNQRKGNHTAKTLQVYTRNDSPPYYMARGGDVALDDVVAGKNLREIPVAQNASQDLKYLYTVSSERGKNFGDFLQELKK